MVEEFRFVVPRPRGRGWGRGGWGPRREVRGSEEVGEGGEGGTFVGGLAVGSLN